MPCKIQKNQIGPRIEHSGQLLLLLVFNVCSIDLNGFTQRGHLLIALSGYLTAIFADVALTIFTALFKHVETTMQADASFPKHQ